MISRMRTAGEALEEIKRTDPETSLTLTAIRRMINCGDIAYVQMNNKKLINLDELLNYFVDTSTGKP